MKNWSLGASLKALFIGRSRDLSDQRLFHHLSLVAVLAWVGLGADGLSSSCYGPEESYRTVQAYPALSLFVALAAVLTIAVLCASYRQIIARFPSGGGGYLVASKLLSPAAGVVSGSALLVDYVLTIAISVASAADALFSVVPAHWQAWKLAAACAGVVVLTLLNLRGVKESVQLWVPVFFLFVGTHAGALLFAFGANLGGFSDLASTAASQIASARHDLGWWGMLALMLRAYSLGAGTYTGIEAVSNGLPILREPRVETARRTMTYMGVSLAVTVFGLLLAYQLYAVVPAEGKTLNAVLLEAVTRGWPAALGRWFVTIAMGSATALLFIAAQAGFLDGPRVLATMALDRWFPARFAALSDRFVTQNGILFMGGTALAVLLLTHGSVGTLVVLYSINVFITFSLSQLGMVVDAWRRRGQGPGWRRQALINGSGLLLTSGVLVSLCVTKFSEGGWITLAVTGVVIAAAAYVRRHYRSAHADLQRLDVLVDAMRKDPGSLGRPAAPERVAVVLVNGFNSLGLHTLLGVARLFPNTFGRYVFVQVGVIDAGTFKGSEEIARLRETTAAGAERYVELARQHGYAAESVVDLSHDIVGAIDEIGDRVAEKYPGAVFFSGQLAFTHETRLTRWLHNYAVFALQRIFCRKGMPFVIVPARV
ncbi:amino acid transporter [Opitutaceae bacterium EW11]|nr:amino acid transporter [Opitutaceae bacterium EW11]